MIVPSVWCRLKPGSSRCARNTSSAEAREGSGRGLEQRLQLADLERLAHRRGNSKKPDVLGAEEHCERWAERNRTLDLELVTTRSVAAYARLAYLGPTLGLSVEASVLLTTNCTTSIALARTRTASSSSGNRWACSATA